MSGVVRGETLKPRYSYKKCVLMSDIMSLDDSPRRKAKVLQAIKLWVPCRELNLDLMSKSHIS